MPTIAANTERWTKHDWTARGDEWSPGGSHAGTDLLWWRTLLPRMRTLLPARRILEIGPGYGRWTDYLRTSCEHLIAIDVTPACIESCRERFEGDPRLEFHVNDGTSLDAAPAGAIDLVFSFDSLVHAEGEVVDRYVEQFARILAPGGAAFVHHSNLGAFVDPQTNDVRPYVTKRHWRAPSMTARRMREAARRAGLECGTQELINWIGRGRMADRPRLQGRALPLTDCLSIVRRPHGSAHPTRVVVNPTFVDEWRAAAWLAAAYPPETANGHGPAEAPPTGMGHKLTTASSLVKKGPAAFARVASERAKYAGATARAWALGQRVKRSEPFVPALRAGHCPDCGGALGRNAGCPACDVVWLMA